MLNFGNLLNSPRSKRIAVVFGVAVVAPVVLPILGRAMRPIAKSALKSGLALYERSRTALAEAGDSIADLYAEVQAEMGGHEAGVMAETEEEDEEEGAEA